MGTMNKFSKDIILAVKNHGSWNEYQFDIKDGRWREALKIFKDSAQDVKIIYR
jgi:5-methylcytosine-specific restriction endonuclease McrBC GTP-binding regulatory subunit McrB